MSKAGCVGHYDMSDSNTSAEWRVYLTAAPYEPAVRQFRRESPKVGRNERCPCGSGMKYKMCCMRKEEEDGRGNA